MITYGQASPCQAVRMGASADWLGVAAAAEGAPAAADWAVVVPAHQEPSVEPSC